MGEFRSRRGLSQLLFLPAAVVVTLLLAAAACSGSGGTPPGTGAPEPTRVEVNQTGGFAGVNEVYTVDAEVDNQRRAPLFDLVGSEQFLALNDTYTENDCRDAFSFTVTVTYSNGTTKNITTDECSQAPAMLTDAIALTKEIGHRHDGK
ncbi:protealysin inhibitor emfourin [Nocardia iowensis]|uniref:Lipoprotein n=1 Tax=Nocardia iowensis TaxID=204891 RepID=A0ABX8RTU4_NOCIO|nr:protealysin inhibitor emfourin [Nocardia iowensis]QXN93063.1 hypothetical protein KV110_08145 [Nocardia iowensis]